MKLPRGLTARQLIHALQQDGFVLDRQHSSHRVYIHRDRRRVVVAYHLLGDTFAVGTLRGMITDAGWNEDKLKELGLI